MDEKEKREQNEKGGSSPLLFSPERRAGALLLSFVSPSLSHGERATV